MPLLAVQSPGASLSARAQTLVVSLAGKTLRRLPLHEVDEVQLYGAVELTHSARNLLLQHDVDTLFLTAKGEYRGRLLAERPSHGERRLAQLRALADPQRALELARQCVAGKLHNQRVLLDTVARRRRPPALQAARVALRRGEADALQAEDLPVLRGIEGRGAALYFAAFGEALTHPSLTFTHRRRRPPPDPVNACLSFGYTLLLRRVESALRRAGLDLYVGALHSAGRGAPALALDLEEEFRVVVDRLVLTLLNRQQLSEEDFEEVGLESVGAAEVEEEGGKGVHLSRGGRAVFLRAWGETWREQGVDQAVHTQARAMAQSLETGGAYTPWRLT